MGGLGGGIGAVAGGLLGPAASSALGRVGSSPIGQRFVQGGVGGISGGISGFITGGLDALAAGGDFWQGAWSGARDGGVTGFAGGAIGRLPKNPALQSTRTPATAKPRSDFMDSESALVNGTEVHYSQTATAIGGDEHTLNNFAKSQGAGGMRDVIVHGNPDGMPITDPDPTPRRERPKPKRYAPDDDPYVTHPQQVVDAVLGNPNYRPGQPIRLVSCYSARGSAAYIARALRTTVLASPYRVTLSAGGELLQDFPYDY